MYKFWYVSSKLKTNKSSLMTSHQLSPSGILHWEEWELLSFQDSLHKSRKWTYAQKATQFLPRARSGPLQLGGGPAYDTQHSAKQVSFQASWQCLLNTALSQMPSNLEIWKILWVAFFVNLQGHNLITGIKDVYVV